MERTYEGFFKNIIKKKKNKYISVDDLKSEVENCFLDMSDSNYLVEVLPINRGENPPTKGVDIIKVYIGQNFTSYGVYKENNLVETLLFAIPYLEEFGLDLYKITIDGAEFIHPGSLLINDRSRREYKKFSKEFISDIGKFSKIPNVIVNLQLYFNTNQNIW